MLRFHSSLGFAHLSRGPTRRIEELLGHVRRIESRFSTRRSCDVLRLLVR